MEKSQVFMPSVDIIETETSFEIYADMPGISIDKVNNNLHVELEGGKLTIRGKKGESNSSLDYVLNEFLNGEYQRNFEFDEKAISSEVKAHYQNGVLMIVLPKKKEVKNKISIQVA